MRRNARGAIGSTATTASTPHRSPRSWKWKRRVCPPDGGTDVDLKIPFQPVIGLRLFEKALAARGRASGRSSAAPRPCRTWRALCADGRDFDPAWLRGLGDGPPRSRQVRRPALHGSVLPRIRRRSRRLVRACVRRADGQTRLRVGAQPGRIDCRVMVHSPPAQTAAG